MSGKALPPPIINNFKKYEKVRKVSFFGQFNGLASGFGNEFFFAFLGEGRKRLGRKQQQKQFRQ
jgi:hypothetical protein